MSKEFGFNPSSWFNNIFYRQEGVNNVYTLTNPNLGDMLSVFTGGYSEANMMLMVQTIPELQFVCNAIAGRVKSGVYSLVDKDGKEVKDNKLWNMIVKDGPNWQFSFHDFIWHAVVHKLVTGNRYGYSFCPSTLKLKHANILRIWLLPPHYTQIFMKNPRPSYLTTLSASEYIDHFHYTGGDSMSDILPEYITHDIYMKLGDATDIVTGKGVSPFKAGDYPLSNLKQVYIARNVIYSKQGALGAVVSRKSDASGSVALTPDEKEDAQRAFHRHGFGHNKDMVSVTASPVDFIKFGANIQELEPFKETEADTAALCAIVGIPISLMPKGQDAKFANLDIAERNLYENVIFAEAESICKFLTKSGHFEEIGCRVVVSFDHVTCLQDDAMKNAQALNYNSEASISLYDAGHITQNELRENIGEEPIEGGDTYKDLTQSTDSNEDNNPDDSIEDETKKLGVIKKYGIKSKRKKLNCFNNGTT